MIVPYKTTAQQRLTPIKAFEKNGHLAICGLIMADGDSFRQAVLMEWFRQADVVLAGTTIGRGLFLHYNPGLRDFTDAEAGCVDTEILWKPAFGTANMEFIGNPVRRNF